MESNLDEIQRGWVRVPVTIILTVFLMMIAVVYGIFDGIFRAIAYSWNEFTMPCFIGPEKEKAEESVDL